MFESEGEGAADEPPDDAGIINSFADIESKVFSQSAPGLEQGGGTVITPAGKKMTALQHVAEKKKKVAEFLKKKGQKMREKKEGPVGSLYKKIKAQTDIAGFVGPPPDVPKIT